MRDQCILYIQLTIYNKSNQINMLRNNIEKYKQKYGSNASEIGSQPKAIRLRTNFTQQDNVHTEMSQPTRMNKLTLTKKIESLTCYKPASYHSNLKLQSQKSEKMRMSSNRQGNSIYNDKMNPEKLSKTCKSSQFYQYSSSQLEVLPRQSQDFIDVMPRNTLFYCTHCYQYIFGIEKNRHYPQCKDAVSDPNCKPSAQVNIAYQKLAKIVWLAKYTSTQSNNIQQLYQSIKRGELEQIQKIQYPNGFQFFKLEEIEWAFAFTYNSLLKGKIKYSKCYACF